MKFNSAKVKEALKALRSAFADEPAAGDQAPAGEHKEYTTDSGAKVFIDKLEAGGTVLQEDLTTMVAPGTITLADGMAVVIGEEGVISEVTAPIEAAADPAPEEGGDKDKEAVINELRAKIAELEGKATGFSTQITNLQTQHTAEVGKFNTVVNSLATAMEAFAEAPSDDPAQPPATPAAGDRSTKEERRTRLAETLAAVRKVKTP